MQDNSKEEQEKILELFKNTIKDRCELQEDILSISEESIDKIASDIVNKFHCFSTKETAHNFLLLIHSCIQIRPLKIPLYGKLLFKISKYLAPLIYQKELMDLFATNKLIVLNLFEANLITIQTLIKYQQTNDQYTFYFCNEIKSKDSVYFGELIIKNEELEDFVKSISHEEHDKKRRIGLNDGEFETMIREDKIPSVHPNSKIQYSLYENSEFLSKATYAEYAAYFGSINILKHFLTYPDLKTKKLIIFAIAGNQTETVNFLSEKFKITRECIYASIEFHTTDDIEFNATNNGYVTVNKENFSEMKKHVNITDLYFSIKKLNWRYFINNILYASDQINDPCDLEDENKSTLLHLACSSGHKEVVKLLLSLFCDKNYFEHEYENDTNLDYVESSSPSDARKSLINVNVQDELKRTPLHLAVSNQKVEIVKILLKCDDTDFRIQDFKGKTVVHYSAESKNKEIVQLFLNSSPNHEIDFSVPDKKGNVAFHYFCKPRCFEPSILKLVCDSPRVNPNHLNHKNVTEVIHSVLKKKKRMNILQVLCDSSRVDLNYQTPERKETALMMATQRYNFEAVKFLMNDPDRIDPNLQDFKLRTALHIGIHFGSPPIVEYLVNQPNVNLNLLDDFELTPVFSALYKHYFNFFELMLDSYKKRKMNDDPKYIQNNIDLQHRDHFSQNLLHYAIRCKYPYSLDFLLKTYSINEPDSKGTTAFHQACAIGDVKTVESLIKLFGTTTDEEENNTIGLYNSSTEKDGQSSLEMEDKKVVDDAKIDRYKPGEKIRINQKDSNGLTPLHYACQSDSVELVKCLLSVPGIKIGEKDKKGKTPFFYACKFGSFEIAKTLYDTNQIDTESEIFNGVSALSCLSEDDQENFFL
ncbi:Ankyrin repeat and FYVE domain-containing protein 1 [Tritrichomonas musculus]|uniref:Ankyrin repeat and FYVE domain-containing protein 1 n=1 Tax=Tritrichomonas musculus TaxID=1915356 RepID=A0ABR2K5Q7_9EUKA